MAKKIFLTKVFPAIAERMLTEAGFEVETVLEDKPLYQDDLIARVQDCNAIICTSSEKIDAHFLNACRHLEIISQYAAGYDNIDVGEATKLGIPIGNAPDAMSEATADVAFGLMIASARRMFYLHKTIQKGEWSYFQPQANLGMELKNKTLGIFGLGRIGMKMAERCKGAYNMDILYCNRRPNEIAEKELKARKVDIETLLKQSDVISVHCSLSPETKGLFNAMAFNMMKPNAIFINSSRGQVHNELDLTEALKKAKIWGAGLDVTNPEPMKADNPLLDMENVAILPHIGSASIEARTEMARLAAQNIIDFYQKGDFLHVLNPEVIANKFMGPDSR